jgi:hypothetical protein
MNKFLAAAAVTAMFALPVVSFAHDYDDGPRHGRNYSCDRDHDGDRDCDHDNRRVVQPYPAYGNRGYGYGRYTPAQVYRTAAVYRNAPVIYRPAPVYRNAPVVYQPAPVYNPTPVVYGQPPAYPYPQQAPVYVQKKHHDKDNDDALWAVGGFVLGAIVGHEVGTH